MHREYKLISARLDKIRQRVEKDSSAVIFVDFHNGIYTSNGKPFDINAPHGDSVIIIDNLPADEEKE